MSPQALVVDDSVTMREMVSHTLRDGGFDVVSAEDGIDAIAQLKDHMVDIVVTDINMPNMNGIELVRHLRADARFLSTPILCLTTEKGEDTKQAARSAGATGWLEKPFDPDRLVSIAHKVCI